MKQFVSRFYRLSLVTFILLGLVVLASCSGYGTSTPTTPPVQVTPAQAPVTPAPSPEPIPTPASAPTIQITSPSGSVKAGDFNGNGVGGVWFVINPSSISTAPASPSTGGECY